jgi:hypothetical protein
VTTISQPTSTFHKFRSTQTARAAEDGWPQSIQHATALTLSMSRAYPPTLSMSRAYPPNPHAHLSAHNGLELAQPDHAIGVTEGTIARDVLEVRLRHVNAVVLCKQGRRRGVVVPQMLNRAVTMRKDKLMDDG